ncbi:type II toxin-antitoxin system tRNA(fMet)-specific endonuclease VapC [Spirulina major]|uniref:type II toxin-antitoxin system tRNA(fMet)-specific endonuclease VapC n=1 Tax=Spirulina major TaxID=270636 RepID=UPI000932912A|nr:type II toxin-antitoxin system VapC family toxin [Spirulina major]
MKYLLDTNICSYIINNKPPQVTQHFQQCSFGDIGISSITVAELNYGIAKSKQRDRNRFALEQFLAPLTILPFERAASDRYGELRQYLEHIGQPIGPMDMLIAAHALSLDAIIITNNVREFQRVPDLVVENWV